MGGEFTSRVFGRREPRELPRGPDERPGTGEYGTPRGPYGYEYGSEGAGRNARIDALMEEMSKQLGESDKALAHYEQSPDVPFEMGRLTPARELPRGPDEREGGLEPGYLTEEEPSPRRPGGMEFTPGAPAAPNGGLEDVGRPGAFQVGRRPARPQRPITRGGSAVREPVIRGGGNTALRFQAPPTGFSLLGGAGGGGSGGSAGGQNLEGFGPDEFENFRRRVLGVRR